MAESGRSHYAQLALAGQSVESEEHSNKDADRQHDVEKARQDQRGQVKEDLDRQTAVYNQIDKPQRLAKPKRGAECSRDKNHYAKALAQNVAVEPFHRARS